jgi:RimJ/RimL family protein N-acetyltransferase
MEYLDKNINDISVQLRDFSHRDIDLIIAYWYGMDESALRRMGVLASRLPSQDLRRLFFTEMIDNSLTRDSSFIFMIDLDHHPAGYYLINNIRHQRHCQQHLHIFDSEHRHKGLATSLLFEMMTLVFDLGDFDKIISEPSAQNKPVNAVLRRCGFAPCRQYYKPSQGICGSMNVNRYEATRDQLRQRTANQNPLNLNAASA